MSSDRRILYMSVVDVVLDDLVVLRETWNDDITTPRLRTDSGILRKLLVNGVLGQAWRASNHRGEPRILAPDLKGYLGDFDRSKIIFAQAGGATYHGIELTLQMAVNGRVSPGEEFSKQNDSPYRSQSLSRFTDGPTIIAGGVTVKRRVLIQYVANKLGGVHYDETRKADEGVFKALDDLPQRIVLNVAGGFDIRYYEMLAIGQLLVLSPDIAEWLAEHDR